MLTPFLFADTKETPFKWSAIVFQSTTVIKLLHSKCSKAASPMRRMGCHHTNSERKPADQVVAEFTRSFAPNLPLPSWPPSDSENCTIHTREAKQVFLFLFFLFLFYWTLIFLFIYETCVELVESGRRCWCDIRDGRGMCIDWIM